MMTWQKKGRIFRLESAIGVMRSHVQLPTVDCLHDDRLRIYFAARDARNRAVTGFIDVAAENPADIKYVHPRPVLSPGDPGCFDDSGVMPSCIVAHQGVKYFYFTGWNVSSTVPYRNAIGLAISEDNGLSFQRPFNGPVLDRTPHEPFFCGVPWVRIENGVWRMWYLSCTKWAFHDGKAESYYHIKYAESNDGIFWKREGTVCIDFKSPEEGGIVRPTIICENNVYRMWFSYRGGFDFRQNRKHTYRIGYAESDDGIRWERADEKAGIVVSSLGWDSQMIAYPFVFRGLDKYYLFYNGNGFGRSGFGYAVAEKEGKKNEC